MPLNTDIRPHKTTQQTGPTENHQQVAQLNMATLLIESVQ